MKFIEEFEFKLGEGIYTYKDRYLHVYQDEDENYRFYEVDTANKITYELSNQTLKYLVSTKQIINHKKFKKYVKEKV